MRYTLESTLPINAFSPRGKGPFSRGMTLEGGGGNNPVSKVTKGVTQAWKGVTNIPGIHEVSTLGTQALKPIDQALVGLDKSVGKMIPGGWGTVGMVAGSMMGLPTWAMTGLGALNGSGVLHPGRGFNMQGAVMGGAMAYGMSQLGQYARAADISSSAPTPGIDITPPAVDVPSPGDFSGSLSDPTGGMAQAYTPPPPPSITSNIMSGNFDTAASQIGDKFVSAGDSIANFADKATTPSTYTDYGKELLSNTQKTASGIGDLVTDNAKATAQADALVKAGDIAKPINAGIATIGGAAGVAQAEDVYNANKEINAQNNQANAEYNTQLAAIADSQRYAEDIMRKNPYKFAEGGMMPRFLSGGGDGLSDDIDAIIGNSQPAKLADGEFVVSADVVSGLGGGSSKAGAKKLYEMMDRVRQQAHGTKKQVRPVSKKALPA